ncbi:unnamed protein product [Arctogadus glacialis]
MDSQLAAAPPSSTSDDQHARPPLEESGPRVLVGPPDETSPSTSASDPHLLPITPVTPRHVSSVNGETSASGGPSKQSSGGPLKTCESDGLKRPIKVKTGMPVLNNQPIRIKIIVRGKNRIISTTTSLTKEFRPSEFTRSAPFSPETVSTVLADDQNPDESPRAPSLSAIMNEPRTTEAIHQKVETPIAGSFDGVGSEGVEKTTEEDKTNLLNDGTTTNHSPASVDPLGPGRAAPEEPRPTEGGGAIECEATVPLNLQRVDLKGVEAEVEAEGEVTEEQTEPLDLSLPMRRRDADGGSGGCPWEDSGCESSLIMEVDEFEGEGDRDVVEEDDDEDDDDGVVRKGDQTFSALGADSFGDSILSPSFFSTSVFASLSSIDSDNDNFLFIDDQGIPYNLSPEGHKVPQIDTSTLDGGPLSGRSVTRSLSLHGQRTEPSQRVTLLASSLGQSLGNPSHALIAPRDNLLSSPQTSAPESPPQSAEPLKGAELSTGARATKNSDSSGAAEPCGTSAGGTGPAAAANQTVQILTNPSGNTPILFLSPPSTSTQFSSSPVGLSLPLSLTQNSAPASTPMLLLLSSVSSTSGPSLALLDPSTGQLSQITAASSGPLSFPALSAGQLSTPGPSVLSYPMIQLGPSNASVVLSGVGNNLTPNPVALTSSSSSSSPAITAVTPTLQTTSLIPSSGTLGHVPPLGPTQAESSDAPVEAEVISKEGNTKPSPFTSGSPPPLQNYNMTFDLLDPLSPPAEADPSSGSEHGTDPSTRHGMDPVPLEDHLYFSSMAPPSPSIFTSSQLDAMDPLDPLDPLSPSSSPNSLGPRKILYCQLCPRVFFYSSDLERHAITHSQKKPHVCQQCGKAFKRSSHLQRHKHIHTGQRNYVCPICAKRFREAGELQRHQRVHTGEKPYQCPLCHTRFAERNTLRRHTKRKHPYHQVAMEMLSEKRGAGAGGGDDGGGGIHQEEEESAEWYSSSISHLDGSEAYMET